MLMNALASRASDNVDELWVWCCYRKGNRIEQLDADDVRKLETAAKQLREILDGQSMRAAA
jgi:hypothetical protein